MVKYYGRAGCGHDYEIEVHSPYKIRHQRLEWMNSADGMCNKCYHKISGKIGSVVDLQRLEQACRYVPNGSNES